jgi:hypothetical protein
VTAQQKRWKARIHYGDKRHHLGTFDTKQEAALVYDRKARQCGKDKLLNYESMKAAEEAAAEAQAEYTLVQKHTRKSLPSPSGHMQARGIAQGAPSSANRHAPDTSTASVPFDTCLRGIRDTLLEYAADPVNAEEPVTRFLQNTEGCPCVKAAVNRIFDEHNTFNITNVSRFIIIMIITA